MVWGLTRVENWHPITYQHHCTKTFNYHHHGSGSREYGLGFVVWGVTRVENRHAKVTKDVLRPPLLEQQRQHLS